MENKIAVVWPRGKQRLEVSRFARRLDTLEGKTIGEMWDWMFHGEIIYPMIEKELKKRYPGVKFVNYEVFGSTHGAHEQEVYAAIPENLKKTGCDAVISCWGC